MLDSREARPLTSREVAKVVSGLLASLLNQSEPGAVTAALDHFVEHRDEYVAGWNYLETQIDAARALAQQAFNPETRHDA